MRSDPSTEKCWAIVSRPASRDCIRTFRAKRLTRMCVYKFYKSASMAAKSSLVAQDSPEDRGNRDRSADPHNDQDVPRHRVSAVVVY